MALYIDFNYVDIRDYVDLSEVDVSYENYLKSLMDLSAEINKIADRTETETHIEKAASDFFSVLAMTETDKPPELKTEVSDVKATPAKEVISAEPVAVAPKPVVAPKPAPDKQQMYIDFINGKYDKSLADFFINILQNPFQTFIGNRFEVSDTIKQDLSKKILGSDESSVEQEEQFWKRSCESRTSGFKLQKR